MITILGFPLTIILGIFSFILFSATLLTGLVFHYLHKPVFVYHKIFAILTTIFVIFHIIAVIFIFYF